MVIKKTTMKQEWNEHEQNIYTPDSTPVLIDIPTYKYLSIRGIVDPKSELYSECIVALYSLSYAIKTTPRKKMKPEGYFDYTVYPLEGVWDTSADGTPSFNLMIRQPDFVTAELVEKIIALTMEKKPQDLLDRVKFEEITDGKCVQMLHTGSYKNEAESFKLMEDLAVKSGSKRASTSHRKIYLSDARKGTAEELKTVLRVQLEA